jgi:hypothetical protein
MLTFSGFPMKGHVFGVTTMHIFRGESLSRRETFVSHVVGLEKLNIVRTKFFMRNKCDQVYND